MYPSTENQIIMLQNQVDIHVLYHTSTCIFVGFVDLEITGKGQSNSIKQLVKDGQTITSERTV